MRRGSTLRSVALFPYREIEQPLEVVVRRVKRAQMAQRAEGRQVSDAIVRYVKCLQDRSRMLQTAWLRSDLAACTH